jgi:hypothetical protein
LQYSNQTLIGEADAGRCRIAGGLAGRRQHKMIDDTTDGKRLKSCAPINASRGGDRETS